MLTSFKSIVIAFIAVCLIQGVLCQTPRTVCRSLHAAFDERDKDLFTSNRIIPLQLDVLQPEIDTFMAEHRPYVRAILRENGGSEYLSIGVKLKGAAGSTRDFHDKPALTINMDKYRKKQTFYRLDKFHLNNSVQDETYLNEWFSWRVFQECQYPAPRVAHATLVINGKDEGLYVLKEGFDTKWLKRHFEKTNGNLYDGGFVQDIDAVLEKDSGDGPDDRSDLQAIIDALKIKDSREKWLRLEKLVDIPMFLKFMAIERILCHWDGYSVNINNYRIYFDPKKQQAIFLPHGLDQILGEVEMGLFDPTAAMLAAAVIQSDRWRAKYRTTVQELHVVLTNPTLLANLEERRNLIRDYFAAQSDEAVKNYDDLYQGFQGRLGERVTSILRQLDEEEPLPLSFEEKGWIHIDDWYEAPEVESTKLTAAKIGKRDTLVIEAVENPCIASWRRQVLLRNGEYEFVIPLKTEKITMIDGMEDSGGSVRVSTSEPLKYLQGSMNWREVRYPFQVFDDQQHVELILELKCASGKIWFDQGAARLERKP